MIERHFSELELPSLLGFSYTVREAYKVKLVRQDGGGARARTKGADVQPKLRLRWRRPARVRIPAPAPRS